MREIPLTRGKVALVDDGDYEEVSTHRWYYMTKGYAARSSWADGKQSIVYLHRFIARPPDGLIVDHQNRDKLDNRRSNLRVCTTGQNIAAAVFPPGVHSRYRGVSRDICRGKWTASLSLRGQKFLRIGYFDDEVAAALAYDVKFIETFGEFARPNFLRYRASA